MVAKINTPKRLLTALNYNEKKVTQRKAICIHAGNYLTRAQDMNFYQKLARLEKQNNLNDRATTKTLHISLNFDPKEKLPKDILIKIATEYMNMIGFESQPYLVYEHTDAAHPHIHIVASAIKSDGSRINTHNIGRNQSEKARREIENLFHLVKADHKRNQQQITKPTDVQLLVYGNVLTKQSISSIVTYVMNSYNYTSLPEFNAALKQFNVLADRGEENSLIYKTNGLLYRVTDNDGKNVGVPVKASSIFSKPTLAKLQTRFENNVKSRDNFKQRIKGIIDREMAKKPADIAQLISQLSISEVVALLRKNADGKVYGITFIDNKNKSVFNGSEIGKQYSIAGLQNSLSTTNGLATGKKNERADLLETKKFSSKENTDLKRSIVKSPEASVQHNLGDDLLSKERIDNISPSFKRKRKKRKRNNNS